jgi:DeoR/GlpR family transcriptional regulator of sugar metabolism
MQIGSRPNERWEKIISLLDENGYLSVKELSQVCAASEITIRRDLEALSEQKKVLRTHGGAASLKPHTPEPAPEPPSVGSPPPTTHFLDRIDALILSTKTDRFRNLLPEKSTRRFLPIIAEATPFPNTLTCVAIDNYAAGRSVGQWAGAYARRVWHGEANILDLTYHLPNTLERSRGFFDGIREVIPGATQLFSLNTHSRRETAYQLTKDAITTDPRVNIIFAINDQSALGAIQACQDLQVAPGRLIVIPFGLEGSTMRNLLDRSPYCQGGLAMFPEVVGRMCVEAAVAAYQQRALPEHLITPYAVVEKEALANFYHKDGQDWKLRPEVLQNLPLPLPVHQKKQRGDNLPMRVGMVVSFLEHEWYKNLCASTKEYGRRFDIEIEFVDIEQSIKEEIELRRREIAHRAAREIEAGEVVFIDAGPMAAYLAEAVSTMKNLTVITNSMPVMECLKSTPQITLISTGGVLRYSSQAYVGPTAEHAISELRVDRLFLSVSGVSVNFGLSHTNVSEVTIKQAMMKSTRRVILLADHSMFESESTIQVAPLNVIHCLITDDALPASARVQISQMGIRVIVAEM